MIAISYVYLLPTVKDAPGAVRFLVNGWQTSGILASRSGDPLTIGSNSNNASGAGQNRDRAVLVGLPYGGNACAGVTTPCKSWLNPASFQNNPAGTYGNIVKGSFVGPRYTGWDMSLARNFSLAEKAFLQFRVEYFNIFNHTNFGDPGTTNNSIDRPYHRNDSAKRSRCERSSHRAVFTQADLLEQDTKTTAVVSLRGYRHRS